MINNILSCTVISIVLTIFYYMLNRNNDKISKKRYLIMFIIVFAVSYLIISCVLDKNFVSNIVKTSKKKIGGVGKSVDIDARLPNF